MAFNWEGFLMSSHPLDRPMWSALTGTHAQYAIGSGGAFRYRNDISVLAGLRDQSEATLQDLAALVPDVGHIIVAQRWAAACPPGAKIMSEDVAFQLVFEGETDLVSDGPNIVAI
jgi:hypothetical protein